MGSGSQGWSAGNPQYQNGFSWVVPGSQSLTGCVLRTFVYYIHELDDWYPCHYDDVELQYKLWGIPFDTNPRGPDGGKLASGEKPGKVILKGIWPNPFNSRTFISLGLPSDCRVLVTIYDILGKETRILESDILSAGYHNIEWDGKDQKGREVPSGVYFARVKANGVQLIEKMTLLK